MTHLSVTHSIFCPSQNTTKLRDLIKMTENGKHPKRRKKDSASVSSGETIDLGNVYFCWFDLQF